MDLFFFDNNAEDPTWTMIRYTVRGFNELCFQYNAAYPMLRSIFRTTRAVIVLSATSGPPCIQSIGYRSCDVKRFLSSVSGQFKVEIICGLSWCKSRM